MRHAFHLFRYSLGAGELELRSTRYARQRLLPAAPQSLRRYRKLLLIMLTLIAIGACCSSEGSAASCALQINLTFQYRPGQRSCPSPRSTKWYQNSPIYPNWGVAVICASITSLSFYERLRCCLMIRGFWSKFSGYGCVAWKDLRKWHVTVAPSQLGYVDPSCLAFFPPRLCSTPHFSVFFCTTTVFSLRKIESKESLKYAVLCHWRASRSVKHGSCEDSGQAELFVFLMGDYLFYLFTTSFTFCFCIVY